MTKREQKALIEHAGHEVEIVDYTMDEPQKDTDYAHGRYTLECVDCGVILAGNRTMIGTGTATSVKIT